MPNDAMWGRVYKRGVEHALRRLRFFRLTPSIEDAKQIVQDGMEKLISRKAPLPEHEDEVFSALGSIINGLTINLSRKKSSRNERPDAVTIDAAESAAKSQAQVLEDRQEAAACLAAMLDRLQGKPLAERVLLARAEGFDKPADIAEELGVSVAEVYRANRLIADYADEILRGRS